MQPLQELARKLLSENTVSVVIGYENGPRGARPVFVTSPEDAGKLIFDPRCVHNLATYLSPRRLHLAQLGKKAVVVKGCDARAVAGLLRENQLKRDDLVVLAVRCAGVTERPDGPSELNADTVAAKCSGCTAREPKLFDHVLGELGPEPPKTSAREEKVAELSKMSAEERWAFWQEHLARCTRCHACREVCPMCFCDRCVADKTQPQWIESSPHARGNLSWQFIRMLHQAGRCVDCGECERVCPSGIPLGLLTRKVASIMKERFAYQVSDDPEVAAPIGTYRLDDQQEFIL